MTWTNVVNEAALQKYLHLKNTSKIRRFVKYFALWHGKLFKNQTQTDRHVFLLFEK